MANVVITLFKPLGDHLSFDDGDITILEAIFPSKEGIGHLQEMHLLSAQKTPG